VRFRGGEKYEGDRQNPGKRAGKADMDAVLAKGATRVPVASSTNPVSAGPSAASRDEHEFPGRTQASIGKQIVSVYHFTLTPEMF